MTSRSAMLKWTSGGSLNIQGSEPPLQVASSKITIASPSRGHDDTRAPSPPDATRGRESVFTIKRDREQDRERKYAPSCDDMSIEERKGADLVKKANKRDRSVPACSTDWVDKEGGQVGSPRKGGMFKRIKKLVTRSISNIGRGSKSAPNSPTPSSYNTDRTEARTLTPSQSRDGRPAGKERRSRLERLIESKRDHRLRRERASESHIRVNTALSDVDTYSTESRPKGLDHQARHGKSSPIWNTNSQTADMSVMFNDTKSKRGRRHEVRDSVSPRIPKGERDHRHARQVRPHRFATCHHPITQNDSRILPQPGMLDRTSSFCGMPSNEQTVRPSTVLGRYGCVQTDASNSTVVPPTDEDFFWRAKLLGISPKAKDDNLYHWLQRVKEIDPLVLSQAKKLLKKVKSGHRQNGTFKRFEGIDLTPIKGKSETSTWSRSDNGGMYVSPKAKLKTSQHQSLKRMAEDVKSNEFLSTSSVTKNNNNGHRSSFVKNSIDILANERIIIEKSPVSLSDNGKVVPHPKDRSPCHVSIGERHIFANPSPHKSSLNYYSPVTVDSRVRRIVHSLEEKISTSLKGSSPIPSSSASSQGTTSNIVTCEQQTDVQPARLFENKEVVTPEGPHSSERRPMSKANENESVNSDIVCPSNEAFPTQRCTQRLSTSGTSGEKYNSHDKVEPDSSQCKREPDSVTESHFGGGAEVDGDHLKSDYNGHTSQVSFPHFVEVEKNDVYPVSYTSGDLAENENSQDTCPSHLEQCKKHAEVESVLCMSPPCDDSTQPPHISECDGGPRMSQQEGHCPLLENDTLIASIHNPEIHETNVSGLSLQPAVSQEPMSYREELQLRHAEENIRQKPASAAVSMDSFQAACVMQTDTTHSESEKHFTSPFEQQEKTSNAPVSRHCSPQAVVFTEIYHDSEIANIDKEQDSKNTIICESNETKRPSQTVSHLASKNDTSVVLTKSNSSSNEHLCLKDVTSQGESDERIKIAPDCQNGGHGINESQSDTVDKRSQQNVAISGAIKRALASISLGDLRCSEMSHSIAVDKAVIGVSFSSSDVASCRDSFSLDDDVNSLVSDLPCDSSSSFLSQARDLEPRLYNTPAESPVGGAPLSINLTASDEGRMIKLEMPLSPEVDGFDSDNAIPGSKGRQEEDASLQNGLMERERSVTISAIIADKVTRNAKDDQNPINSLDNFVISRACHTDDQIFMPDAVLLTDCPMPHLVLEEAVPGDHDSQLRHPQDLPVSVQSWSLEPDGDTEAKLQSVYNKELLTDCPMPHLVLEEAVPGNHDSQLRHPQDHPVSVQSWSSEPDGHTEAKLQSVYNKELLTDCPMPHLVLEEAVPGDHESQLRHPQDLPVSVQSWSSEPDGDTEAKLQSVYNKELLTDCPMPHLVLEDVVPGDHESQLRHPQDLPVSVQSWSSEPDGDTEAKLQSVYNKEPAHEPAVLEVTSSDRGSLDKAVNSETKWSPTSAPEDIVSPCARVNSLDSLKPDNDIKLKEEDAINGSTVRLKCPKSSSLSTAKVDQMIWTNETSDQFTSLTGDCCRQSPSQRERACAHAASHTEDRETEMVTSPKQPPLDPVAARIAEYYNLWYSVRTQLAEDRSWESMTWGSADLCKSSSSLLTDMSRDGSGDRSAGSCSTAKMLKFQTVSSSSPMALSTDTDVFTSSLPSDASLGRVATPGGKEVRFHKRKSSPWPIGTRPCRFKSSSRGRYRNSLAAKPRGARMKWSVGGFGRCRRSSLENSEEDYDEEEREEDHFPNGGITSLFASDRCDTEEMMDTDLLDLDKSSDIKTRHQDSDRNVLTKSAERKKGKWFLLATMLFFQFLIHWLYAR